MKLQRSMTHVVCNYTRSPIRFIHFRCVSSFKQFNGNCTFKKLKITFWFELLICKWVCFEIFISPRPNNAPFHRSIEHSHTYRKCIYRYGKCMDYLSYGTWHLKYVTVNKMSEFINWIVHNPLTHTRTQIHSR